MRRNLAIAAVAVVAALAVCMVAVERLGVRPRVTVRRDVGFVRANEQLLDAIERRDAVAIRALIEADPSIPRGWTSGGQTALHLVARRGDAESIRLFIDAGANVNAAVAEGWAGQGMTPLMYAAAEGQLEAVRELLRAGAALSAKEEFGKTAAEIAEINGHMEIAKYLRQLRQGPTQSP